MNKCNLHWSEGSDSHNTEEKDITEQVGDVASKAELYVVVLPIKFY